MVTGSWCFSPIKSGSPPPAPSPSGIARVDWNEAQLADSRIKNELYRNGARSHVVSVNTKVQQVCRFACRQRSQKCDHASWQWVGPIELILFFILRQQQRS